jgi:hypothetical protein
VLDDDNGVINGGAAKLPPMLVQPVAVCTIAAFLEAPAGAAALVGQEGGAETPPLLIPTELLAC